jgi:alpha-L-fucosidase
MLTTPNRLLSGLLLLLGCLACSATLACAPPWPPDVDERLQWFEEARFGMFVHWGPVSLKGTEIGWSRGRQIPAGEYDQLYLRFDPQEFEADAWAKLAREAGMKYLVLTSKHHDGFCLWDSKVTDYDIMASPYGRDVVADLAAACARQGVKFCLYYSIADWYHPHYHPQNLGQGGSGELLPEGVEPDMDVYVEYMNAQLRELLTNYGDIGLLWFDGEWEKPWTEARGADLYDYVRSLQPSVIVNNRVGKARHGVEGTTADSTAPGDYDTPEQQIGRFDVDRPWESCITICRQWAWKPNDQMKSLAECLQTLIACAGGDGNLLFNVGPMPNGRIEPRQADRLREMGAWLGAHGETIYGTRGGPWQPGRWGACTHRGDRVYLHVTNWPGETLYLPALPQKIVSATLRTARGEVDWAQSHEQVRFAVAAEHHDPIDTIIELRLAEPVRGPAESGDALSPFETDPRYGECVSGKAKLSFSSTSQWSQPKLHRNLLQPTDARLDFAFHTDQEANPWVKIDLGARYVLTGAEVRNRLGIHPERAETLGMLISDDGTQWREVWRASETAELWEISLLDDEAITARYVKFDLRPQDPTWMHLHSIRLFGRPIGH